jgi:hypothetical protein
MMCEISKTHQNVLCPFFLLSKGKSSSEPELARQQLQQTEKQLSAGQGNLLSRLPGPNHNQLRVQATIKYNLTKRYKTRAFQYFVKSVESL